MSKNESQVKRYEFFLEGELIDLCIPSVTAINEDGWAEWFNDIDQLQASRHGVFPNYKSSQHKILESLCNDRSRIVLLICQKISQKAFGVVSLQNINLQSRSAEIVINASSKGKGSAHPLSTLEAMALITQHGFEQLGLDRVYERISTHVKAYALKAKAQKLNVARLLASRFTVAYSKL